MPLGYHVILSTYGFWLPNDPRGSWSKFVGSRELYKFGSATKIESRKSVAHVDHDIAARLAAKSALIFDVVELTGRQAKAVGEGFARACLEGGYAVYACVILPNHVHLVLGFSTRPIGQCVGHLKGRATQALQAAGLWPEPKRPVWARSIGRCISIPRPICVRRSSTSSTIRSRRANRGRIGRL